MMLHRLSTGIASLLPIASLLLTAIFFSSCNSLSGSELRVAFPNLRFSRPVDLQYAPGVPDKLFVVEQAGVIRSFTNSPEASHAPTFLDIREKVTDSANEEGLLGLAFHPLYAENGYFYVNYTASSPRRTVISRYSVNPDHPEQALSNTEIILLEVEQPYGNHNGGQISFGPDGYLYIGMGDGGSAGDPLRNGQNRSTLLGAILRIDVDNSDTERPYSIPTDNPFTDIDRIQPEVYAFGLRNPWRFSFDQLDKTLWVGDVGQNEYEEINIVDSGGNYGWNIREGAHCFNNSSCDNGSFIDPVFEYGRRQGGSITGGFVYRGTNIPELMGKYIYADFVSGRVWGLSLHANGKVDNVQIANTNLHISSFGVDSQNELYICAFDGLIYTLNRPE